MPGTQPSPYPDATGRKRKPSSSCLDDPWIGDQIFQSVLHPALNRQFRRPAKLADPATIEKDEGIAPDPAALTAGIFQPRLQLQALADPADRLVNLAIFVLAK